MKTLPMLCLVVLAMFAGCATTEKTFYWGNYSSTLYDFKRNPDDETLAAHKKSLLLVMEESGKKKKPVPPGVYAEYGYILLRNGDEAGGMEYLDKETSLYPEAIVFIQRIKGEYGRRDQ